MGILYLFTKFEPDCSTNNGDPLSDRNHWTDTQTHTLNLIMSSNETFSLLILSFDLDQTRSSLPAPGFLCSCTIIPIMKCVGNITRDNN